jgi:putative transcriptional regulator
MPIRLTQNVLLAQRNLTARDVAAQIGLSETQMSMLRMGKVRGLRFDTAARLCYVLDCKPGDLIDCDVDPADFAGSSAQKADD